MGQAAGGIRRGGLYSHVQRAERLLSDGQRLAENYGGRVQVVNNHRISVSQRNSVMDAMLLAEADCSAAEIRSELERMAFESIIFIGVDTLK